MKPDNRMVWFCILLLDVVVLVVSIQRFLNCSNEVGFSNTPMFLINCDGQLEIPKLLKEHKNRELLERKITCGDIYFIINH